MHPTSVVFPKSAHGGVSFSEHLLRIHRTERSSGEARLLLRRALRSQSLARSVRASRRRKHSCMPLSEIAPGSDESPALMGARWATPILTANRLWTRLEI